MSTQPNLLKKMDHDLAMYRSTRSDAERLGHFYSVIFTHPDKSPDMSFLPYVSDLLNGRHPTFHEDDFIYIQEESSGKIVSAMNLISQTWTYGGIPIPAGRPETVATDPDYRNRGLVRAMFDVIHEWSRQRGELLQGITGIPYYYRLFGYEMCLEMEGGWKGTPDCLPAASAEQQAAYKIRRAEEKDIPFIAGLYDKSCERLLMACPRSEATWKKQLLEYSPQSDDYRVVQIIEAPHGEPLGMFLHPAGLGPDYVDDLQMSCYWYALKKGVPYLDVTPVVLRHLLKSGREYALEKGKTCSGVGLYLDSGHPAYKVLGESMPRRISEYAWYIRVPDLAAFITKIAPVLEKRLDDSWCSGYTGSLEISFYRSKLTLAFDHSRLQKAEEVPFRGSDDFKVCFPAMTFYHLLFGHRTLEEIENMYPDCLTDDRSRALLNALFPRCPSDIWPL